MFGHDNSQTNAPSQVEVTSSSNDLVWRILFTYSRKIKSPRGGVLFQRQKSLTGGSVGHAITRCDKAWVNAWEKTMSCIIMC
jgi:hypothetical protein